LIFASQDLYGYQFITFFFVKNEDARDISPRSLRLLGHNADPGAAVVPLKTGVKGMRSIQNAVDTVDVSEIRDSPVEVGSMSH